jgi:F420-non-reducing hydrogenase iron-sulfur subunit
VTDYEPLIVLFACRWGGAEAAPRAPGQSNGRLVRIEVRCAGNVHPNVVVEALSTGVDGVVLAACAAAGCHYPEGDEKARSRAEAIQLLLEDLGMESERFRFELLDGEPGELDSILAEMAATLRALGPNPYA